MGSGCSVGGGRGGSIILCGKQASKCGSLAAAVVVAAVSDEEPERKPEEPECGMRRPENNLLRNQLLHQQQQQQEFRGFRVAAKSADKDELLSLHASSSSFAEA